MFVAARCKKFGILVECGSLGFEHDQILLKEAQPALVSDSIVRSSSPDDIPGYLVGNVFIFQFPDIGAQGSGMLIISII